MCDNPFTPLRWRLVTRDGELRLGWAPVYHDPKYPTSPTFNTEAVMDALDQALTEIDEDTRYPIPKQASLL